MLKKGQKRKQLWQKLIEGAEQIAKYMKDKRLANRPYLKKFVVVFIGFEVANWKKLNNKLGE